MPTEYGRRRFLTSAALAGGLLGTDVAGLRGEGKSLGAEPPPEIVQSGSKRFLVSAMLHST